MEMHHNVLLQEVVRICESVCGQESLSSSHAGREEVPIRIYKSASMANVDSLRSSLQYIRISSSLRQELLAYCLAKQEAFKSFAVTELNKLINLRPSPALTSTFRDLLESAVDQKISAFSIHAQKIVSAVVSQRVNRYEEQIQEGSKEDTSSDDLESSRGHSRLATTILERAFQYAPNITAAERNKLASATGLKPKQVTIWYQNRRNRKITTKPFIQDITRQPLATTTNAVQKRKRAELYGSAPRYPSQRQKLSPEDWSARTENEADNGSDFSSLRSSSLETTDSHWSGSFHGDGSMSCTITSSFYSTFSEASCQTQSVGQEGNDSYDAQECRDGKEEYIFDAFGQARLDFEDLELDIATIEAQLPRFSYEPFEEYSKSSYDGGRSADGEVETGRTVVGQPFGELFPAILYNNIDKAYISTDSLVQSILSEPGWNELWSSLTSNSSGAEAALSLHSNDSTLAAAETSSATQTHTALPHPNLGLQGNPFDFSLDGLGLSEIVSENEDTFYGQSLYTQFLQHEPHVFEPFRAGTFVDEDWI